MNKLFLILRNITVAFVLLLTFSRCETIPTIIFTTPQDKQEYFKNEEIEIKVIIADTKGKSFPVQLYIDDILFGELLHTPYYFTIKAGSLLPKEHIIKITTTGTEAFRSIKIKDVNSESDDFVTFTNGIIPAEWTVTNWNINTLTGVDDNFSITTMLVGAQVSTNKKCSKISFYMKGTGVVDLYLDNPNIPWQTITLGAGDPLNPGKQDWILYEFTFPNINHTFTWKFVSGTMVGLDAIRFEK
jgi:hypothetical protein